MNLYSTDQTLLYSSHQSGLKRALEEAVQARIALPGINLRRARLRGAALDGMVAPGACLWGVDLSAADLAGADLKNVDARMATFKETCLADAALCGGNFSGAYFNNTLFDQADLVGAVFSCPSILMQALHRAASLEGAIYWHRGEEACDLSKGITRLTCGAHEVIALGARLIVNGKLEPPAGYLGKKQSREREKAKNFAK